MEPPTASQSIDLPPLSELLPRSFGKEQYYQYHVNSNLRRKAVRSVKKRRRLEQQLLAQAEQSSRKLALLHQEQGSFNNCNGSSFDGASEDSDVGGVEDHPSTAGGSGAENEEVGQMDYLSSPGESDGAGAENDEVSQVDNPPTREERDEESEDERTPDSTPNLAESLASWAVEFGIRRRALSALLVILGMWNLALPKDARTLLKTDVDYKVSQIKGGMYFYFGILNSLGDLLTQIWDKVENGHRLRLQLNFDGLPLFKSSNSQLWPILGLLKGFKCAKPFVIGLFCGSSKPKCLQEYLRDLVEELKSLHSGIVFRTKKLFITVSSVMCDAPARAYIKAIKGHSGYNSCDKCTIHGTRIKHSVVFTTELDANERTDESFRLHADEDHHTGISPLTDTYIGMVTQFPHDYMHLACLGVMRKMVNLWSGGPLPTRLQSRDINRVSERLKQLKDNIPSEFARKPRGLDESNRWKATEWRQFMLYTAPVALKNVLVTALYENFMLFSTAMFILASPNMCIDLNDYAKTLLKTFVDHFGEVYGKEHTSYNIHGLMHLADDVKEHGHLDNISGFPFENYLGQLKCLIRQPQFPVAQVIRRLSEMKNRIYKNVCDPISQSLRKPHNRGPVPFGVVVTGQYSEIFLERFCIKTNGKDNCVRIGDVICLVRNIVDVNGTVVLVYNEFQTKMEYFNYPLSSTQVGIYSLSNLNRTCLYTSAIDSVSKYVLLEDGDSFVGMPLLHTD